MVAQPDDWDPVEFEALLALDEDALAARIGRAIPTVDFAPGDVQRAAAHGRAWLATRRRELRARVCADGAVQALMTPGTAHSRITECAAVADALAVFVHGMPIATIAVFLVREGLTTLCGPP